MTDQTGAPKPLKIVGLLAENIKRLSAVEIKPDGSLVEVVGKNGAGKSSVLDSITWAIEGARHIQAQPIRKGWNQAKIRLDLGEFEVTRRFRRVLNGDAEEFATDLEIRAADGSNVRRPQEILNSLFAALAFDPGEFISAPPPEKFAMLRRFVPDVDFEKFALDEARDYEERTNWNRRARDYEAQARACPADMGATGEPIDEAAIADELAAAGEVNTDIATRKANRERAASQIAQLRREFERAMKSAGDLRHQAACLIAEAEKAEARAAEHAEKADHAQERLEAAPPLLDPIDTAAIKRRLDEARLHNSKIVGRGERLKLLKQAEEAKAKADALTKQMAARQAQKQELIAAAAMPVPGLGFEGEGVTLDGVPFEQASSAEQIGAALRIAMAMHPRLRVILIREASLIDADGMELIRETAEQHGFQVWAERVQASGIGPAVLIADGAVRKE